MTSNPRPTSTASSSTSSLFISRLHPGSSNANRITSIYDRNLQRRAPDVSLSAFGLLFSVAVQYCHTQSRGIQDVESRLNGLGYRIGQKLIDLVTERQGRNGKRETRILRILHLIHTTIWKAAFGRVADGLEKSKDQIDEYMIIDNAPLVNTFISVPKELSQLSCAAFSAGIIESVMDSCGFPSTVTAHSVPLDDRPHRTVFLIKLDKSVIEREELLSSS